MLCTYDVVGSSSALFFTHKFAPRLAYAALSDRLPLCSSLKRIALSDNNFNGEGLKHLAAAISKLHDLESLTISHNSIASGVEALSVSLQSSSCLRALDISHASIGDEVK